MLITALKSRKTTSKRLHFIYVNSYFKYIIMSFKLINISATFQAYIN